MSMADCEPLTRQRLPGLFRPDDTFVNGTSPESSARLKVLHQEVTVSTPDGCRTSSGLFAGNHCTDDAAPDQANHMA